MARITIDAGHGGRDKYNRGPTGYIEAEGTLIMAIACQKKLTRAGQEVIMTRETDIDLCPLSYKWVEWMDLAERAKVANVTNSDYFVSIHTDASSNLLANGTTTYCIKKGYEAEKLGSFIQKAVTLNMKTYDRGVREGNFAVLRETNMPAILVEVDFHTNLSSEANLKDNLFLIQAGESIADGILNFLGVEYQDPLNSGEHVLIPVLLPKGQIVNGYLLNGSVWVPLRQYTETLGGYRVNWLSIKSGGMVIIDKE